MNPWKRPADIIALEPRLARRRRAGSRRRTTDRLILWAVAGLMVGMMIVSAVLNREAVFDHLRNSVVAVLEWHASRQPLLERLDMPICARASDPTCVIDGDTIRLDGERIRLLAIDAPELFSSRCEAEYGLAMLARDRLAEVLSEEPWRVVRDGTDRYGRTLAKLRLERGWAGTVLVREGLAHWWEDRRSWC
jgi:micrococcal nuclease